MARVLADPATASSTGRASRTDRERVRRTMAAWERFVAGEDDVQGVPSLILLSWQRSRDTYLVDPVHASPPPSTGASRSGSLLHDAVLAQLGAIAAALADRTGTSLTTVADGSGRILGCWGDRGVRRRGTDSHLAPMFTWSESCAGTNGTGTALGRVRPVSVCGPEHWCASLHDWSCNGISIGDPVTGGAIAVLTISFWRRHPSPVLLGELERQVAPVRRLLAAQAVRDASVLAEAFLGAEAMAGSDEVVIGVDTAGNVVAANQCARSLDDRLPAVPATEPADRVRSLSPRLRAAAAESRVRARRDPNWVGASRLDLLREEATFEIRPVIAAGEPVGLLLVGPAHPSGEPIPDAADTAQAGTAQATEAAQGSRCRIVGTCDGRLIILRPGEIRYAEADRHTVWLVTDRGRVRAASRGLDNVERELVAFGFLRVHRGYLVNLHRIREVDHGLCKGTLTVSTQHHGREAIPVARHHVPDLRAALGI